MQTRRYEQLILFGDSITEWSTDTQAGFALQPALQFMYSRRLDVINRGFSGYNTAHALKVLPKFFPSPEIEKVRVLVVFFGANDACVPGSSSGQHIPLEQYRENLRLLVTHPSVVQQKPTIIIVTPPPVDEDSMAEHGFQRGDRTAVNAASYANAAREVAAELDLPCCDLWTVMMSAVTGGKGSIPSPLPGDARAPRNELLRSLLTDGLHFRPAAYRIMFDALRATILKANPDLDPEKMPMVFPYWADAPKAEQPRC